MWRNLESLTVAVKEGVKEFQQAAREGVLELQGKQSEAGNGLDSHEETRWAHDEGDQPLSPQPENKDAIQQEHLLTGQSLHEPSTHIMQSGRSPHTNQQQYRHNTGHEHVDGTGLSGTPKPPKAEESQGSVQVPSEADNTLVPGSSETHGYISNQGQGNQGQPEDNVVQTAQTNGHGSTNRWSDDTHPEDTASDPVQSPIRDPHGHPSEALIPLRDLPATATVATTSDHTDGANRHSRDNVGQLRQSSRDGSGKTNGLGKQVLDVMNPGADSMSEAELRKGYLEMKAAYEEMKALLQKSMQECMRLSDEMIRTESQARAANAAAAEHAASAKAAGKEASELNQQLAAARKEAAAAQRRAEQLKQQVQELQQQKQQIGDTANMEALRNELSNAVRKAAAAIDGREAAEARCQIAESARQAAESARMEADRLRREAEAAAQAATAAAEAERSTRAEAEGATEALRADQERRARIFNNAVRTAVGKLQRELEAERDSLQAELREARQMLSDTRAELRTAQAQAEEANTEAAARAEEVLAANNLAASAEAAAERAAAREAEALAAAHSAEAAHQSSAQELQHVQEELATSKAAVSQLEAQVRELSNQLEAERASLSDSMHHLETQLQLHQERAERATQALKSVEKQLEVANTASAQASERAAAASSTLQARVAELEAEVQKLRVTSNSTAGVAALFQMPTKQDVLAGLGLDTVKDHRLRWKNAPDVEAAATGGANVSTPSSSQKTSKARLVGNTAARVLGVLPMRTLLLVAYLLVLHIAVMVSFTRNTPDLEKLCSERTAIGVDKLLP